MSEPKVCPFMKCACNRGQFKVQGKWVECRKWEWIIKPNKELKHKGQGKCTAVVYLVDRREEKMNENNIQQDKN